MTDLTSFPGLLGDFFMNEKIQGFAKRLFELRKTKGWSQPEIGKMIGTSGAIIGRYERGEMTPSIEVAKKLADVFTVTVDHLINDKEVSNLLQDKSMLDRWQAMNTLESDERERILSVMDSLLRDAQARKAYQTA